MQASRAHPFFSRLGCGTALALAVVLGILLYLRGGGPFSPGPVSAAQPRNEPLQGYASHAAFEANCGLCHAPWSGPEAARCEDCHEDVAQQRLTASGLHGVVPDTARCQTCHTDHKGKEAQITHMPANRFDHGQLTPFTLARHETGYDGQPILCADCHQQRRYEAAFVDCATCHRAADAPFMAGHTTLFGADCLACHDGVDTMAAFDHAAVFVLEGAHESAPCEACHVDQVFATTPQTCAACHQEPEIHAGLFGLDCARCHTAVAWQPAQLTLHNFPLDHGDEGKIDCQVCHLESYTAYTCTNCHAHQPDEINRIHVKAGILEFENCVECHPTGAENEAKGGDDD